MWIELLCGLPTLISVLVTVVLGLILGSTVGATLFAADKMSVPGTDSIDYCRAGIAGFGTASYYTRIGRIAGSSCNLGYVTYWNCYCSIYFHYNNADCYYEMEV